MNGYDDKEYISQLQNYLYYISLKDVAIPRIVPDGIYGKQTRNAVSAFQKAHGLKITGDADIKTWEAIKADYDMIMQGCEAPDKLSVFPGGRYTVHLNEKSDTVSFIQLVLICLNAEYRFDGEINVTGIYNENDAAAVKKLQKIHGLKQTGAVDCVTWNCMATDFGMYTAVSEYKR